MQQQSCCKTEPCKAGVAHSNMIRHHVDTASAAPSQHTQRHHDCGVRRNERVMHSMVVAMEDGGGGEGRGERGGGLVVQAGIDLRSI